MGALKGQLTSVQHLGFRHQGDSVAVPTNVYHAGRWDGPDRGGGEVHEIWTSCSRLDNGRWCGVRGMAQATRLSAVPTWSGHVAMCLGLGVRSLRSPAVPCPTLEPRVVRRPALPPMLTHLDPRRNRREVSHNR